MSRSLQLALTLAVLGPAELAIADDVVVTVEGCPELADPMRAALRLEIADGWRVVEGDGPAARVQIALAACDAARWTVRVRVRDGSLVSGPDELAMDAFAPGSRVRVAALWAAERLPNVEIAPTPLADPSPPETRALAADPAPPEPAALEPPAPERYPHPAFYIGAGFTYLIDPRQLAELGVLVRGGAFAQVLDWLVVGGSLEGGALFEPFDHVQPFLRLCAEPHAVFDLGVIAVGVGPKVCASVSRHLWAVMDHWVSGLALGGFARAVLAVERGLGVALRIDLDAWGRDLLLPVSDAAIADPSSPSLPWAGVFAASLELELR